MSTLYVNKIRPQAGTVVAVTGTLDVSGSVLAHKFESITHMDTTYEGSNKFGNDTTDTHQFTGSIFVDGNSTLGNAAADVATVTAQLTASQGLTSTDAAFFNANVTLGNAAADVTTSTGQLTGSQGAYFNNRVGIGTAAPGAALDIDGDINLTPTAISTAHITSAGSLTMRADANMTIGDSTVDSVKIGRTNTTAAKIHLRSGTDNDLVVSNSKVGIGVSDPDSLLEVFGTSTQLKLSNNTADYATLAVGTNGDLTITTVDATATNANLTMTVDGDIILGPGGGDVLPDADNTRNLGSSAKRWANVYTGDLHLKNERGDWTILEESDYLCVVNNATGKKYKMMLQEIDD